MYAAKIRYKYKSNYSNEKDFKILNFQTEKSGKFVNEKIFVLRDNFTIYFYTNGSQ